MAGLLAAIMAVQATIGPACFAHDQALICDAGMDTLCYTAYSPTCTVSLLFPAAGEAVFQAQLQYRQILPTRRPVYVLDLESGQLKIENR